MGISKLGLALTTLTLFSAHIAIAQSSAASGPSSAGIAGSPEIEMRVPFDPTAFPSAGRTHLFYELALTNAGPVPVALTRVEVVDAEHTSAAPIAVFEAAQLDALLPPAAGNGARPRHELAPGKETVVFVGIVLDESARVPAKLLNRIHAGSSAIHGPAVATNHSALKLLGPPVQGGNWRAGDGPGNEENNHHRRGVFRVDGRAVISRRYAVDWMQVEADTTFGGDPADARSYHAYGEPVLAVGDGRVVTARDGLPDNVPRHNGKFQPAIALTMETVPGNEIVLDIGDGQFAHYLHLRPGTVRVKSGDLVRRGDVLGETGVSGDAREPHLHFEVTTRPEFAIGEGVPYVIDRYSILAGAAIGARERELPLNDMIVDFCARTATE